MKLLIDTDPGTDDYIALIMALRSPEVELVGLTTVGGNASLEHTTANTLSLLEYLGRQDILVAKGSAEPLAGRYNHAYYHHGDTGLTVAMPSPTIEPVEQNAVDFIIEAARNHQGELVLAPIGPLTNIAKAFQKEPRIAGWLREMVIMGGAFQVRGNVTRYAEFNIAEDPEAARQVLAADVPIRMVGLDVCNVTCVTRADQDWFRGDATGNELVSRILTQWFAGDSSREKYELCDPLAIAAILRPDLLQYRKAHVEVVADDSERRGQTLPRFGEGGISIAVGVDAERARSFVKTALGL
jgi:purine nucleosidase